jgi:hypothetical protein
LCLLNADEYAINHRHEYPVVDSNDNSDHHHHSEFDSHHNNIANYHSDLDADDD